MSERDGAPENGDDDPGAGSGPESRSGSDPDPESGAGPDSGSELATAPGDAGGDPVDAGAAGPAPDAADAGPDTAPRSGDASNAARPVDGERPALALCFSGGKDSTLAALVLDSFYDVRLVTVHFDVTDAWKHAREAADALGYPFETVVLDRDVAAEAVDRIRADGYPRNGIQYVHERALEAVADLDVGAVADGTRRDDRVPTVSRAQAQSLEDRHGVDYIAPLSGFGRGAVDRLVDATLEVEVGPSETVPKADYETELRTLLVEVAGEGAVDDLFPAHTQTRVRGFR